MDKFVKALLGDFAFTIAGLQFANEQLRERVKELEDQIELLKEKNDGGFTS